MFRVFCPLLINYCVSQDHREIVSMDLPVEILSMGSIYLLEKIMYGELKN